VWSGDYSAVAPRNLKRCIGKYAPQFNGFSQHDAQEFLAFLLDGLHEDLNRVRRCQRVVQQTPSCLSHLVCVA
jgi:ubiquitin C-terminal hydrolase